MDSINFQNLKKLSIHDLINIERLNDNENNDNDDKIRLFDDIDSKIKNYNKNLNYNSFNDENNNMPENFTNDLNKFHEKNNSENFSNNFKTDNNINIQVNNNSYMSIENKHRKYTLEKRIREFKKKLTNDLNNNPDNFMRNLNDGTL